MAKSSRKAAAKKSIQKSSAGKISAPKKSIHKRIDELEQRIKILERDETMAPPADALISISFEIKFYGGAGEIQFVGENIDRTDKNDTVFSIDQSKEKQRVQVGGTAPRSANGRIEVQVKQGNTILSKFSDNVFKNLFNSEITYTIK